MVKLTSSGFSPQIKQPLGYGFNPSKMANENPFPKQNDIDEEPNKDIYEFVINRFGSGSLYLIRVCEQLLPSGVSLDFGEGIAELTPTGHPTESNRVPQSFSCRAHLLAVADHGTSTPQSLSACTTWWWPGAVWDCPSCSKHAPFLESMLYPHIVNGTNNHIY